MLAIVVAYAQNRVIGRGGALPWRLPSDMRHFRELTIGGTVLMGRRTFESLPDAFRPLPQRRNLVLSRDRGYDAAAGAELFAELDEALASCAASCFVIGGEQTYRETLPSCGRVHATEILSTVQGDVRFPELPDDEWTLVKDGPLVEENGLTFRFRTYERAL